MPESKGKKQYKKIIIIVLVSLFLLFSATASGYLLYLKVYLPAKSREYVNSLGTSYDDTKGYLSVFEEDVSKPFYLDQIDVEKEGVVKEQSLIDSSYDVGENVSSLAEKLNTNIGKSNPLIDTLGEYLREYQKSYLDLGNLYMDVLNYEQEVQPYIESVSNISDQYEELYEYDTEDELDDMITLCETYVDEYEQIKLDVESITTSDTTQVKQEAVLEYIDEIITLLSENITLTEEFIEASNSNDEYQITIITYEYAKLELNFEDATDSYLESLQSFDEQTRKMFQDKVTYLEEKQDAIDSEIEKV